MTFGLSDVYVFTVFARGGMSRVGLLPPRYTILRSRENMPQCLKRFLDNFNVVASQNSLYGFRNEMIRPNSNVIEGVSLHLRIPQ